MDSYRRPRGKIFFEVLCALLVGASFVGAWIQTGAWAFVGPAFVFTLFGLYWSFDLFGARPTVAAQAVTAAEPAVAVEAAPEAVPEFRFERFEAPVVALEPQPVAAAEPAFSPGPDVVPFVSEEPAPAPKAKARKPRAKKATPVVEPAPVVYVEEPEPIAFVEEVHPEPHIEQLFDPQPFARQARPAFGKRPRGPGPRPMPA